MALTKVTRSGITDNSVNAAKIEDGTVVDADITPGTLTAAKLASTLDLSSKTVTLPNTSVTSGMLAGSIANAKLANSTITINGASTALGASVSAGSIAWQSVIVSDGSTVTTMVAGRGYFVNNASAAGLVKLPAGGTAGDTIAIKDYAGNFATNNLTIQRNSHKIQGVANDSLIQTNRASLVLVYIDATKGWLFTNESNVADLENAGFTSATGGTVTTSGDFKIHSFTGDGNFVVSTAGFGPAQLSKVDYLVVAGGGGGGGEQSGGGGAGGYRESKDSDISSPHTGSPLVATTGITLTAQTYPISVGAGGARGSNPDGNATAGSNSVFSTITSTGGGRGATSTDPHPAGVATTGGSGGGGATLGGAAGAAGNTPPVSPPQGNNGGNGAGAPYVGGGGGGAGAAGTNGAGNPGGAAQAGPGGNGVASSITGSSVTRAGGGGAGGTGATVGGNQPYNASTGGSGGGGAGAPDSPSTNGTAATANTGGGGGGGNSQNSSSVGGAGGKGIVIIRYKYQ